MALFQLLSVAVNDSETTACSSQGIWLKLNSYIIYHLFSLARDSENISVIMSFNQIKSSSPDLEQETVLNSCKMKNKAKKIRLQIWLLEVKINFLSNFNKYVTKGPNEYTRSYGLILRSSILSFRI